MQTFVMAHFRNKYGKSLDGDEFEGRVPAPDQVHRNVCADEMCHRLDDPSVPPTDEQMAQLPEGGYYIVDAGLTRILYIRGYIGSGPGSSSVCFRCPFCRSSTTKHGLPYKRSKRLVHSHGAAGSTPPFTVNRGVHCSYLNYCWGLFGVCRQYVRDVWVYVPAVLTAESFK
jgi:hypothetical protein